MANRKGWWTLSVLNTEDDEALELSEADRIHISELIKEGYIEGEIVADEEIEEETDDNETT